MRYSIKRPGIPPTSIAWGRVISGLPDFCRELVAVLVEK